MTFADHGGFDLALDVTEELLSPALLGAVTLPNPPDRDLNDAEMDLRVHVVSISAASVDVLVGERVLVRGDYVAQITVVAARVGGFPVPIPPGLSVADVRGTFAVPLAVSVGTVGGGARGVVLAPAPGGGSATVDQNALFASPPVQLLLAMAYVAAGGAQGNGEMAYQQRRQDIAARVDGAVVQLVQGAQASITRTMVIAEPAGLTFGGVRTSARSLKVLASLLLAPGNPAAATAVTLRRNALGAPLDHVALVLNNGSLLSAVRAAVSAGLGIPPTFPPWAPGHPSVILASTPVPTPPGTIPTLPNGAPAATVSVEFLLAQVNAAGLLQVDIRIQAVAFQSLATVVATATATAPVVATVAGGALTVGLGTPAIAVTSDVQINPFLYVIAVLLGQFTLFAILATLDLFAGPFLTSLLTTALGGAALPLPPAVAIPLAGPFAALTALSTSGVEPGAPLRVVTLPGPFPIPLPLDRAQDVTARFA
ncbi:hypothetical protein [Cellulomonas fimi]|uniref:Uncharacterized protein n=1 Tax=Cellulomonas fimi TaxID=1708 RepID=A0A7Y0M035_CELFI|nr:hypothetical protein [Cellulomonas fimi]NMR21035.1 hypothetical protein [Cellulomonas fimi]